MTNIANINVNKLMGKDQSKLVDSAKALVLSYFVIYVLVGLVSVVFSFCRAAPRFLDFLSVKLNVRPSSFDCRAASRHRIEHCR